MLEIVCMSILIHSCILSPVGAAVKLEDLLGQYVTCFCTCYLYISSVKFCYFHLFCHELTDIASVCTFCFNVSWYQLTPQTLRA